MSLDEAIEATGQSIFTSVTALVQHISGKRGSDKWNSFNISLEETRYRGMLSAEQGRIVLGIGIRLAIKDGEGNRKACAELSTDFGYVDGSTMPEFKHDLQTLFSTQASSFIIEAIEQLENMANLYGFQANYSYPSSAREEMENILKIFTDKYGYKPLQHVLN